MEVLVCFGANEQRVNVVDDNNYVITVAQLKDVMADTISEKLRLLKLDQEQKCESIKQEIKEFETRVKPQKNKKNKTKKSDSKTRAENEERKVLVDRLKIAENEIHQEYCVVAPKYLGCVLDKGERLLHSNMDILLLVEEWQARKEERQQHYAKTFVRTILEIARTHDDCAPSCIFELSNILKNPKIFSWAIEELSQFADFLLCYSGSPHLAGAVATKLFKNDAVCLNIDSGLETVRKRLSTMSSLYSVCPEPICFSFMQIAERLSCVETHSRWHSMRQALHFFIDVGRRASDGSITLAAQLIVFHLYPNLAVDNQVPLNEHRTMIGLISDIFASPEILVENTTNPTMAVRYDLTSFLLASSTLFSIVIKVDSNELFQTDAIMRRLFRVTEWSFHSLLSFDQNTASLGEWKIPRSKNLLGSSLQTKEKLYRVLYLQSLSVMACALTGYKLEEELPETTIWNEITSLLVKIISISRTKYMISKNENSNTRWQIVFEEHAAIASIRAIFKAQLLSKKWIALNMDTITQLAGLDLCCSLNSRICCVDSLILCFQQIPSSEAAIELANALDPVALTRLVIDSPTETNNAFLLSLIWRYTDKTCDNELASILVSLFAHSVDHSQAVTTYLAQCIFCISQAPPASVFIGTTEGGSIVKILIEAVGKFISLPGKTLMILECTKECLKALFQIIRCKDNAEIFIKEHGIQFMCAVLEELNSCSTSPKETRRIEYLIAASVLKVVRVLIMTQSSKLQQAILHPEVIDTFFTLACSSYDPNLELQEHSARVKRLAASVLVALPLPTDIGEKCIIAISRSFLCNESDKFNGASIQQSFGAEMISRIEFSIAGQELVIKTGIVKQLLDFVANEEGCRRSHSLIGLVGLCDNSQKIQEYVCKSSLYKLIKLAWTVSKDYDHLLVAKLLEKLATNSINRTMLYKAEMRARNIVIKWQTMTDAEKSAFDATQSVQEMKCRDLEEQQACTDVDLMIIKAQYNKWMTNDLKVIQSNDVVKQDAKIMSLLDSQFWAFRDSILCPANNPSMASRSNNAELTSCFHTNMSQPEKLLYQRQNLMQSVVHLKESKEEHLAPWIQRQHRNELSVLADLVPQSPEILDLDVPILKYSIHHDFIELHDESFVTVLRQSEEWQFQWLNPVFGNQSLEIDTMIDAVPPCDQVGAVNNWDDATGYFKETLLRISLNEKTVAEENSSYVCHSFADIFQNELDGTKWSNALNMSLLVPLYWYLKSVYGHLGLVTLLKLINIPIPSHVDPEMSTFRAFAIGVFDSFEHKLNGPMEKVLELISSALIDPCSLDPVLLFPQLPCQMFDNHRCLIQDLALQMNHSLDCQKLHAIIELTGVHLQDIEVAASIAGMRGTFEMQLEEWLVRIANLIPLPSSQSIQEITGFSRDYDMYFLMQRFLFSGEAETLRLARLSKIAPEKIDANMDNDDLCPEEKFCFLMSLIRRNDILIKFDKETVLKAARMLNQSVCECSEAECVLYVLRAVKVRQQHSPENFEASLKQIIPHDKWKLSSLLWSLVNEI